MTRRRIVVVAAVVALALVAGAASWATLRTDRLDVDWVDDHFPATSRYDDDEVVRASLRTWSADYGEDDVVQEQLRDAAWTTEGFSALLARLALTVTSPATAGDTAPRSSTSRADDAARVVSRALAALDDREDLDDVRADLTTEEQGPFSGSLAMAALVSSWGLGALITTYAEDGAQPGGYDSTVGGLGELSDAPLLTAHRVRTAVQLAITTDVGLAHLVDGFYQTDRRYLEGAVGAQSGDTSSLVGSSMTGDLASAWADVAHLIATEPDRPDGDRARRLGFWADRLGEQAAGVEDLDPAEPGTAEQPEPFATVPLGFALVGESTAALRAAEPVDVERAATLIERARVLLLVGVLEAAGAWEQRPGGFVLPAWDEVSGLDEQAWQDRIATWQAGTPIEIAPTRYGDALRDRVVDGGL